MWEVNREQRMLLLSMHHSLFDGWSASVLQDDLAADVRCGAADDR